MIIACLATIPGREESLAKCLASLRPQVDEIRVICHDVEDPPDVVRELADEWICEPDRFGSAAKLRWSREVSGLYLGCDDDLLYPPDYTETMLRWVRRWRGRAICAIGGRVFEGNANTYPTDGRQAGYPIGGNAGEWVNYPNAAGIAFDTRLNVPSIIPEKNQEEAYLAIWAQANAVPVWLVPKPKGWIRWLLEPKNPGPTIWESERSSGYQERQRLMAEPSARGWTMPVPNGDGWPSDAEPFAAAEALV